MWIWTWVSHLHPPPHPPAPGLVTNKKDYSGGTFLLLVSSLAFHQVSSLWWWEGMVPFPRANLVIQSNPESFKVYLLEWYDTCIGNSRDNGAQQRGKEGRELLRLRMFWKWTGWPGEVYVLCADIHHETWNALVIKAPGEDRCLAQAREQDGLKQALLWEMVWALGHPGRGKYKLTK